MHGSENSRWIGWDQKLVQLNQMVQRLGMAITSIDAIRPDRLLRPTQLNRPDHAAEQPLDHQQGEVFWLVSDEG